MGTAAMGNEDCLNLNVYAPSEATSLPVVFFIHGSGNRASSNRAEAGSSLDGQYLGEHGPAVVVVINYRLGALGWLAHPSLDAESAAAGGPGTSGNYGMLDQIAALQWVQRNIAVFGGDPSQVMITGHSAGTQDAGVLLASPLAKGLFASVLLDGGGFAKFNQPTLPDYEASVGADVVKKVGCNKAANIPACLRAVPSVTFVKNANGVGGVFNEATYRAIIDGFVLKDNVLQTAKEGEHNHVPLIIGGGARETANPLAFISLDADPDAAAYRADVNTLFGQFGQTVAEQVLALYPSANYRTPPRRLHRSDDRLSVSVPGATARPRSRQLTAGTGLSLRLHPCTVEPLSRQSARCMARRRAHVHLPLLHEWHRHVGRLLVVHAHCGRIGALGPDDRILVALRCHWGSQRGRCAHLVRVRKK